MADEDITKSIHGLEGDDLEQERSTRYHGEAAVQLFRVCAMV